MTTARALIVDYGGVLTASVADAMHSGFAETGIDPLHFGALMREWMPDGPEHDSGHDSSYDSAHNPVHALERGEVEVADIEAVITDGLVSLGAPAPEPGFLSALCRGFETLAGGMVGIIQRARALGFRTALLSNSWGFDYDRTGWDSLFDAVVISGEVGMRKPEPGIYQLTADRLGALPGECVFVDDLPVNVRAAVLVGMIGVHHTDIDTTAAELAAIFGHELHR